MHQQWHADLGHGFEHREDFVDAGDAGIGVGCRSGRVQLGGIHDTAGLGHADFLGLGTVGEVQHHQRFKVAAGRACGQDALAIGASLGGITHGRYQVGHDDCASKGARNVANGVGQDGAITKMDVPVVGTQEGQAVGHWGFQAGRTQGECYRKSRGRALAIKFCDR
ncbi:hypothetical protein D3C79_680620 [compost metagenome]